jgi:hypothetical protein
MLVLTKSFQLKNWERIYFVKGLGRWNRTCIIDRKWDNTKIFLDGVTLFKTLNKGEYADIDGNKFTNEIYT